MKKHWFYLKENLCVNLKLCESVELVKVDVDTEQYVVRVRGNYIPKIYDSNVMNLTAAQGYMRQILELL